MNNPLRLSLRLRSMALLLLALVPAFGLLLYHTIDDNRRASAEVKIIAQRLACLAAQNHEQMIDDAHDLLVLLVRFSLPLLGRQAGLNMMASLSEPYPNFANVETAPLPITLALFQNNADASALGETAEEFSQASASSAAAGGKPVA